MKLVRYRIDKDPTDEKEAEEAPSIFIEKTRSVYFNFPEILEEEIVIYFLRYS